MAEMNLQLPAPMMEFIEDMVARGAYSSSSEVVGDALRLLRDERAAEDEKLAILQREVAIGLDQARTGRFSERSVAHIAEAVRGRAKRS